MPCNLPGCLRIGVDPVAIHAGSFAVYWYGLFIATGFVLAIRVALGEAERREMDSDQVLSAILVGALVGLIGARIFYVLQTNPGYFIDPKHIGDALSLWQGGLAFYGGIVGGVVGAGLYASRYNLPILAVLDLGALVAPLGQAVGRIGNLVNGDLAGYVTNGFGVEYTNPNNGLVPPDRINRTQHPIALYDLAFELVLFAVLWRIARRAKLAPGQLAGLYLAVFSAWQLVLYAFRTTPITAAGLKGPQLLALPLLAAGLWLFLRSAPRLPLLDRAPA